MGPVFVCWKIGCCISALYAEPLQKHAETSKESMKAGKLRDNSQKKNFFEALLTDSFCSNLSEQKSRMILIRPTPLREQKAQLHKSGRHRQQSRGSRRERGLIEHFCIGLVESLYLYGSGFSTICQLS